LPEIGRIFAVARIMVAVDPVDIVDAVPVHEDLPVLVDIVQATVVKR